LQREAGVNRVLIYLKDSNGVIDCPFSEGEGLDYLSLTSIRRLILSIPGPVLLLFVCGVGGTHSFQPWSSGLRLGSNVMLVFLVASCFLHL
jgi:hypothetical protein